MGLLEVAREIRAGKRRLSDVPEGSRRQVQRLLPVAGEAPKPLKKLPIGFDAKFRRARTA